MNEQLKQAIKELVSEYKEYMPDSCSSFAIGMQKALSSPSILRHCDPEIMKQAGWVREEEFMQDLMNRTFDKMKTKDNLEEIKSILSEIKPKP